MFHTISGVPVEYRLLILGILGDRELERARQEQLHLCDLLAHSGLYKEDTSSS